MGNIQKKLNQLSKNCRGQLKIHVDRVLVRVKIRQDMSKDANPAVVGKKMACQLFFEFIHFSCSRIFRGRPGECVNRHARDGLPEHDDEQGGAHHGQPEHPHGPHGQRQGVHEEGV